MNPSFFKNMGFILLIIGYISTILLSIKGFIGLNLTTINIAGFILLFIYVIITKLQNTEDKYYEDNIEQ